MIIELEKGKVASWWFEGQRTVDLKSSERQELLPLLERIRLSTSVMQEERMLLPQTVTFDDWVRFHKCDEKIVRMPDPDIRLELDEGADANTLSSTILTQLDERFVDVDYLYPLEINITGKGMLLDATGNETEWPNVIWIHAVTFGVHIIEVCTQSYAWLPYDLAGRPQTAICDRNAYRLEGALRRVSHMLDIEPIVESESDYAIVKKFRVLNRLDVDGEPVSFEGAG